MDKVSRLRGGAVAAGLVLWRRE